MLKMCDKFKHPLLIINNGIGIRIDCYFINIKTKIRIIVIDDIRSINIIVRNNTIMFLMF